MPSIPCTSAAKYTAGLGSARVAKTHEGRNSTRVLRGLKHKRYLTDFLVRAEKATTLAACGRSFSRAASYAWVSWELVSNLLRPFRLRLGSTVAQFRG